MSIESLFNIQYPLIQAPLAGVQNHQMAAAVSNAGGLGSIPCAMLSPNQVEKELSLMTSLTDRPYNVNFFCHQQPNFDEKRYQSWLHILKPYYKELSVDDSAIKMSAGRQPFSIEALEVISSFKPKVVSFHFGLPDHDLLTRVKSWGAKVLSSATTIEEALWLETHGADIIIAQGLEAGGHRGMFLTTDINSQMGTFGLLPQIIKQVKIPVIAAGGIVDNHTIKIAMQMGASGVQIGTAYMLCDEAFTTTAHREILQQQPSAPTTLTNLFTGRPARGFYNKIMKDLGPLHSATPEFPLATSAISPLKTAAETKGLTDFTHMWSGQNTSGCKSISASTLTQELVTAFETTR